jgi:hypothetical protein
VSVFANCVDDERGVWTRTSLLIGEEAKETTMRRRQPPRPHPRRRKKVDADASPTGHKLTEWVRRPLLFLVDHRDEIHAATARLDQLLQGDEVDYYPVSGVRRTVRTIDKTVAVVAALGLLVGERRGSDRT